MTGLDTAAQTIWPGQAARSRASRGRLGCAGGLSLALWTAMGMAAIAQSPAEPLAASGQLVAQAYLHELPPPPTVPFGESPALPPTAAVPAAQPSYLVYVNGNSPLILQQVQAVEPTARLGHDTGRSVIQVGVFPTEAEAYQRVQQLEERGIGAMVEPMGGSGTGRFPPPSSTVSVAPSGTGTGREVEFGQAYPPSAGVPIPVQAPTRGSQSARYMVVVPGDRGELWAISQQVERLIVDIPPGGVQFADRPLGPHVQVGPFPSRAVAENWETYLRAFGMDARVHYR